MKRPLSLHQLYQRSILIVLSISIGILGIIWLGYEYQAGLSDIDNAEAEYIEEKKKDLRRIVETMVSGVQHRRLQSQEQTKQILRNKMKEGLALASELYLKNKDLESPAQIKQHIIDILMASKFMGGKGYFWILDTHHTMLAHPYNQDLVGQDQSQLVDKNGSRFIQEFVQTALNYEQGGFVSYYWTAPHVSSLLQNEQGQEKIAFVKSFQPYNWVIGVGLYVHDLERKNQQEILGRFASFRHGETGYIFNHTFAGLCLNHNNKELVGTNRWELTDDNGYKVVQELCRVGRQPGGGFLEYNDAFNPLTGQSSRKLSYVKAIDEWQWVLGTGIYLDEIETKVVALRASHKQRMLGRIGLALVLITMLFFISYWGLTFVARKLEGELQVFMEFFAQASKKQLKIDSEQLHVEEFRKLAGDVNRMIESQNKIQQAVFQAKKIWERTFDAVPDSIIILDEHQQIIQANQATAEVLQIPIESLIYRKCYEVFHATDVPPSYCPQLLLLKDHQTHQSEFFDENLQRHLNVTVSPIRDSQGEFIGSVHIARDITAQKKAEIERVLAEEKLRKTEKMEAIGLMAGGVAHDLNNILSGVVSYPELLLMQLSEDDPFYKPIQSIQESGLRAAAVVSDLLTVARGVVMVKEVSSINTIIAEYLQSAEFNKVESLYPEVAVKSDLDADLSLVSCSPIHIQKMLMNLITNAMEAIEGEGQVFIKTENLIIAPNEVVAISHGGEYVGITIRDTGTGIAKETLKHIFEPFYSTKIMGRSGTGLGLAVVWNTVKDHGGVINVESDESGTIFRIYLHSSSDEVAPIDKEDVDIELLKGHESVLVIDDEQQQREIASQMLLALGYSVETVASGEQAIEFCHDHAVDVLLLDMIMDPGINGLQTYQAIIKEQPAQKAIIASGFSESDNVKTAFHLGVGGFLKKPYSVKQLGQKVKDVLQG